MNKSDNDPTTVGTVPNEVIRNPPEDIGAKILDSTGASNSSQTNESTG